MPKTRFRAALAHPASADEVAAAFYEALHQSDLARLMACWADDAEILCVQPGGSRLVGPDAIHAAFEAMFEAEGSLSVAPEHVRKCETAELSIHSVLEKVSALTDDGPQQFWVVATLIFGKTALGWRLMARHASAGATDVVEVGPAPTLMH